MSDMEALADRFTIPDVVSIDSGKGGMTRVVVTAPGGSAHIYLHGAHVTHFQPHGGKPVLFLSEKSHFDPGKAIRGGVPLIFPWFGPKSDNPSAPQHGFARTSSWALTGVRQSVGGSVSVTLELAATNATRALWPHDFHLKYTVVVSKTLEMILEVQNASSAEFRFEEALHSYYSVADARQVTIDGLSNRDYLDKTDGMRRKTQPPGPISLTGETDRVYLNTPDAVSLVDASLGRKLKIEKEGSASTVLWNPWSQKAKEMADFGADDWLQMTCVETANAAENVITLAAQATHRMRACVSASASAAP